MSLNADAIVAAGLELLDRYGLGDLSMRRVAETLGVKAGALYYHVPNKQSLLAGIADEVLGAMAVPDDELPPDLWLTRWAGNLRCALLARRDGAELVASTLALGLGRSDPRWAAVDLLEIVGIEEAEATVSALMHFVLGHVTAEQTRSQLVELGVVADFDGAASAADFRHGVALFVRGALWTEIAEVQRPSTGGNPPLS